MNNLTGKIASAILALSFLGSLPVVAQAQTSSTVAQSSTGSTSSTKHHSGKKKSSSKHNAAVMNAQTGTGTNGKGPAGGKGGH